MQRFTYLSMCSSNSLSYFIWFTRKPKVYLLGDISASNWSIKKNLQKSCLKKNTSCSINFHITVSYLKCKWMKYLLSTWNIAPNFLYFELESIARDFWAKIFSNNACLHVCVLVQLHTNMVWQNSNLNIPKTSSLVS